MFNMRFTLVLSTLLLKILTCTAAAQDAPAVVTKYQQNPPVKFVDMNVDLSQLVVFSLYTRSNPDEGQQLRVNDVKALEASNFNVSLATKFVTHGWTSSCNSSVCVSIRQGFLTHDNYNVIAVDWSPIANKNYFAAAVDVQSVGCYVARMVDFLKSRGSDLKTMTLAGHSLGAHVVGLAGRNLTTKVGHIVGLDPAGPGFEVNGPNGRISSLSGDIVEIVHTDMGVLGMVRPIGHQDYYPNGGVAQPGCGVDVGTVCSHGRSYVYYAESLRRPDAWLAVMCDGYTSFLSGTCDHNARASFPRWAPVAGKPLGVYQMRTNAVSPFGIGYDGSRPYFIVQQELLS